VGRQLIVQPAGDCTGLINTPLELAILNETSRFHLVIDVNDRVPWLQTKAAHLKEEMRNTIIDSTRYAHEHGTDRPRNHQLGLAVLTSRAWLGARLSAFAAARARTARTRRMRS